MKTNIVRVALFTPGPGGTWGLPLLLWGLPGVAKTAILRQLAAEYGLPIETLSPAARGEGAFGVTPVPAGGRMTYPRPDWTDRFEEAGRGIVFVDEINLAASHYAGALLGLLSERVLGSYQFPPGVRVMAAANPPSIAAASGGWDLSAPAANRVGHLDWESPKVEEWVDWLFSDDDDPLRIDAAEEEDRILHAWPDAWARARGAVAGFLGACQTHMHAMPAPGSEDTSRAWPSPRTWEYATRALASSSIYQLPEAERESLVCAFVGGGAGGEFFEWLKKASLPNSADLLDGKIEWHHIPSRLDISQAVYSSAVAVCVSTEEDVLRRRRAAVMWELLAQAVSTTPDIIVPHAKTLVRAKLFQHAVKVVSKIGGVLAAAGIQESN